MRAPVSFTKNFTVPANTDALECDFLLSEIDGGGNLSVVSGGYDASAGGTLLVRASVAYTDQDGQPPLGWYLIVDNTGNQPQDVQIVLICT